MNVGDFFAQLSYGELASLFIGEEGAGTIATDKQSRVINFTNKALTRLYSRFAHKTDYVNCLVQADLQRYRLHPQHAVSDTNPDNNAPRYLQDSVADPFLGNLIKIVAIRLKGEDEDDPSTDLLINDTKAAGSVRMLSYDEFFIEEPVEGQELVIEVQLGHPALTLAVPDLTEEIHLAPVLYEALEALVASKVFGSMGGEAHDAKSMKLEAEYERICKLVENKDLLQNTTTTDHDKFSNNGFV